METVPCSLCGSSKAYVYFEVFDYLLERRDVKTLFVRCDKCGLIYQNPRPTLTEMEENYPSLYGPYNEETKGSALISPSKQIYAYGMRKRSRVVNRHKKSGRILDVGCATGAFIREMRERGGWEVYGVDVSRYAINIARRYSGLNVYCGVLEEVGFEDEYFDVVTMWDVFEHIHRPMEALFEIYRILKPHGLLVIRVPNANSWNAKIFGKYWSGLDSPRHLHAFSKSTLTNMLKLSGYDILSVEGCRSSYMIFLTDIRFMLVGKGIYLNWRNAIFRILGNPLIRMITFVPFYFAGLGSKSPAIIVSVVKK